MYIFCIILRFCDDFHGEVPLWATVDGVAVIIASSRVTVATARLRKFEYASMLATFLMPVYVF